MRLARVLQMPPAEIAFRGRVEACKWLDRWAPPAASVGERHAQAPEDPFDHFVGASRTRFFDGAMSDETPRLLRERAPEAVARVLAIADAACEGRFDLLGYRGLDFGRPVDWHFDPLAGRRAPRAHWSRIRPLDARSVGDSKLIWELNRHQWMVALGQAYRISGDERYAKAFAGYMREWLAANPRGQGINWTSSLELAFRLIAWCWAFVLFRGSPELRPELFLAVRGSVASHAAHVAAFLSSYFSPNTHLTGEALGLVYAGLLFPELSAARSWRDTGVRILVDEIKRQVLHDGVYFEQSTAYQCYTVEIYLHFLLVAARNRLEVPAEVAERVQQLLDFLLFVRRPDGGLPAIGDADGGRLLPLVPREPQDATGLFAVAAAHFGRSDYAWAAGRVEMAPEILWLLGPPGLAAFDALEPRPPAGSPSRVFATGGYAVFRSGWEPAGHQLIFDAGPLGCPTSSGHGHADLLSIQLSAFGQPFLVDPGTYTYTTDPALRDHFRSSLAHNTVTLDGKSQARPAGPFSWRERPRARLRSWILGEDLDFARADHDAYARLGGGARHRRRVLFVRRQFWLLVDDIEGSGEHRVEQRFQFAPLAVGLEPSGWVRARGQGGDSLWLRSQAAVPLAVEARAAASDPAAGWIAPDYGQRRAAPIVIWSVRTRLPLRIVTLLVPLRGEEEAPPAVSLVLAPDGTPRAVVLGPDNERIPFDDDELLAS
ncbi:MAG: alginate lyase family protein [Solirubrobacterales bacterium]|jgi:hypothetical protein